MRIVATGDTHVTKLLELPTRLIELMDEADLVIHTGDFVSNELLEEIEKRYNLLAVYGNSDDEKVKRKLKQTEKIRVNDVWIGVVHRGNYLNNFDDLGYKAKELGVNLLIFGHIHRFVLENFGDVIVLSPGSPTKPRQSVASCAIIDVKGSKVEVKFEIIDDIYCGMDVELK
uniref:Phosphoesterase n=1 Tax=Geoglobus ahangari TaxID=113653 RepID=A0A7C3YMQ0_9EURY